jgi:hypothetical protein
MTWKSWILEAFMENTASSCLSQSSLPQVVLCPREEYDAKNYGVLACREGRVWSFSVMA